jgi:2,4-didehydro-3-deoxy-L-rhamnonate hydrolase
MQIANRKGRAVLVQGTTCVDVEQASGGTFPAEPGALFGRWTEFLAWAATQDVSGGQTYAPDELGPPSPRPAQVFGIGTNYRQHAEEVGWPIPEVPLVFTKFPSSVAGPVGEVELSGPRVDWEVEVVVVIGEGGRRIRAADAWRHVAGITGGQDISDRDAQMRPADNPQHSLGKSFPGYASIGPLLVTPDELDNPDDIALSCSLNGEQVQSSSTADLIFPVAELIEYLSEIVVLLPGDLIFTGTPSGVGTVMDPPRFLTAKDEITSWVAGAGEMRLTFADRPDQR